MTLLEAPTALDEQGDRAVVTPPERAAGGDPSVAKIAAVQRRGLLQASLMTLAAVATGLIFYLAVVGAVQHKADQTREYLSFRKQLAAGTAPTGQTGPDGKLVPSGTPVAIIQVPSIGMDEVVDEGTTSQVLMAGPGHLPDTPLPGQPGVSVIMGRQALFGGPFKNVHDLKPGALIKVTVGFGNNYEKFRVLDVRHSGGAGAPPLASGASRLILVTAAGTPLVPNGLVYVDAELVSAAQPATAQVLYSVPSSDNAGQGDTSTLWSLVLWLQALLIGVAAATWAWYRWGRLQTWVVFVPLLLLIGYFVADQVGRILPNVI